MKNIEELISNMKEAINDTQELEALRAIALALVDTLSELDGIVNKTPVK